MVNPSSVIAHLVKLVITIGCTRQLGDPYRATRVWSLRAFQIYLVHSILGILRYGTPFFTTATTAAKGFRNFYNGFSRVVDIVPLALLTTDILHGYKTEERIRLVLLLLGTVPLFVQLAMRPKENKMRKYNLLINITATLQLLAILLAGLRNGNYSVISLTVSYAFQCFFLEEFCYRYDVPYIDLVQYCISFVEFFATMTLKEI